MNEGDVAVAPLPQANGVNKLRPVLLLRQMSPFGDWLVCGVSTQLRQRVPGFDELVDAADADFQSSGLKAPSVLRLGFLAVLSSAQLAGSIGSITPERHRRLLQNLSKHLSP